METGAYQSSECETSVEEEFQRTAEALRSAGIEEPRLEAEVLLRHLLGLTREKFYLKLDEAISPEQRCDLAHLIHRRIQREPVAYITGHKEFFGLDFLVTPDTLIPRPETELLVERALELARDERLSMRSAADIGTGCGAIAVAMAVNMPFLTVYATDISTSALEVAAINCKRHWISHRVHLEEGNLLEPLDHPVDLIVANLPYVSDSEFAFLSDDIRLFEPELSLYGGQDGLYHTRELIAQAKEKLNPGGVIILEISPYREKAVIDFARGFFPEAKIEALTDLGGHKRVIEIDSAVVGIS
ncbi:MAG: peptide chain release factor N(5)-glutamine methyltransferase [Dehalococcoidia bacterium]